WPARRASARLQGREVRAPRRARRAARWGWPGQGRLLGRPRLRVVRGHLAGSGNVPAVRREGQGASPADHADPRPAASSRKGPRDSGLRLRRRAEDTGPRGMPPAPPAAAWQRNPKKLRGYATGPRVAEGGAGEGTSPAPPSGPPSVVLQGGGDGLA